MNKKLLILICTLTMVMVGACFCGNCYFNSALAGVECCSSGDLVASATVADSIIVRYADNSWVYYRSYSGLDNAETISRGVGLGGEIQYDIAQQLISSGYTPLQAYNYVLPNFANFVDDISSVCTNRVDATVDFVPSSSSKFVYRRGVDGVSIDIDKLAYILLQSHHGETVDLPILIDSATTVDYLKQNTVLRSTFSTSYTNKTNRVANIARASSLISGSVVLPNGQWSFNQTVGERTQANGFCSATVIVDGKYHSGVGGGVCQVSTTLYNALLLADLRITAVCQHSLVPSYIEPSFDSMVSFPYADLCFVNDTSMPIYIECTASTSSVRVNIYGSPNKVNVVRRSQTVSTLAYDTVYVTDSLLYPQLLSINDTMQIVPGSTGVVSMGYVDRYMDNTLISTSSGRKCSYAKVDRVVARGAE